MKNIGYFLILIIFVLFLVPTSIFAANSNGYASISGYVKDSITGLPVSHAKLKLIYGSNRFKIRTNRVGYYEFSKIPLSSKKGKFNHSAWIIVYAKKYFPIFKRKKLSSGKSYVIDFKLKSRFAYPIVKGRVFDSSSWMGIPDAVVTAASHKKVFSAITDQKGNYLLRLETRVPRSYSLSAKADQYQSNHPQMLRVFPRHTYNLNIYMEAVMALGISVTPDNWPIGNLGPNSIATMQQGQQITVTNTGNNNQTYSLMVRSPESWTASQSVVGAEQYILNACFSSDISSILWNDQSHSLLETLQRCSEIKFAGDQNGVNILPGGQRTLWMQFKAPLSTVLRDEQVVEVIINAEIP